ncbi:hypothetical protein CO180_02840 [candidate division WWE3 bacterium CG_4_9_14_3_um_filter_41_6]|uniref:SGNH hydrolase-type esterase domain-containing protein n=1 Tax=candidate division WWE3 bacterium CG_4_10_14_0_2_um_filter_41_14 TaxID=1975072 RepID=A0A2M7TJN2_UNCKA|nr:MAG: hypothetical protein COY32_02740 [candidate division WWE3 bacterium CG_4_10_14_0_2_um_filter_41_14]PJA38703.1 MAG: hypothetical protein CO180_02840 [candidate division WWE3 bacterium CG_4_9_14_3_um_filter_41_6]
MNICIFGDSITWGSFDPEFGGWATRLRNYFESLQGDVQVYVLGVTGDTTTDLVRRFEVESRHRDSEIIVFAVGINDARSDYDTNELFVSTDEVRHNLDLLVTSTQKFTNSIVFIGPTLVDESKTIPVAWEQGVSYKNEHIEKVSREIMEYCEAHGIMYIPMDDLLVSSDLYDGVHPNMNGHNKMFMRIKPQVEELL